MAGYCFKDLNMSRGRVAPRWLDHPSLIVERGIPRAFSNPSFRLCRPGKGFGVERIDGFFAALGCRGAGMEVWPLTDVATHFAVASHR
jgi:hypothetical protein